MVDTIKIELLGNQFRLDDKTQFRGQIEDIYSPVQPKVHSPLKSTRNATKAEKEIHGYMPQIAITKRYLNGKTEIKAQIQFSAPKILFNENFTEVTENDYETLISKLAEKLKILGMRLLPGATILSQAKVLNIHYSKNILLEQHTVSEYIRMLQQCRQPMNKHTGHTHYQNGGTQFRYGTKLQGFVAYDKVKDLEFASKRGQQYKAYDKDSYCQMSLFEEQQIHREILRIEKRLNGRQNIINKLRKLSLLEDLFSVRLIQLFSKSISQQILLNESDLHQQHCLKHHVFSQQDSLKQIEQLMRLNPNVGLGNIAFSYCFNNLLYQYDHQTIRNIFRSKDKSFLYYESRHRRLKYPYSNQETIIDFVRKELEKFQSTHLDDIKTINRVIK